MKPRSTLLLLVAALWPATGLAAGSDTADAVQKSERKNRLTRDIGHSGVSGQTATLAAGRQDTPEETDSGGKSVAARSASRGRERDSGIPVHGGRAARQRSAPHPLVGARRARGPQAHARGDAVGILRRAAALAVVAIAVAAEMQLVLMAGQESLGEFRVA